jgi:hypothetical protein
VPGHERPGGVDPEVLGENRAEPLDLHLPEAGQGEHARTQIVAVGRVAPYGLRVAAVLPDQEDRQVVDPLGHHLGVAVHHGRLAEDRLELRRHQRVGVE